MVYGTRHSPRSIYLATIDNQTAFSDISPMLTLAMRSQLKRLGIGVASAADNTQNKLKIRVFGIAEHTAALVVEAGRQRPVIRKWEMRSMVTLQDSRGAVLFGPELISVTVYSEMGGESSVESKLDSFAKQQMIALLSRKIAIRVAAQTPQSE